MNKSGKLDLEKISMDTNANPYASDMQSEAYGFFKNSLLHIYADKYAKHRFSLKIFGINLNFVY